MSLTPGGEYFAKQCQAVLAQYNRAVKQARFLAEGRSGTSGWGSTAPYTQECIPDYLRRFRQLYPEAAITLQEGAAKMLEALEEEKLDVIVIPDYGLALDQRFDVLELSSERPKFMTGPQSPLAGRQYVAPRSWRARPSSASKGRWGEPQPGPGRLPGSAGPGGKPGAAGEDLPGGQHSGSGRPGHRPPAGGDGGNLSRDVSVFSIEGDSFRIRTVALRLLPSVSLAGDHFFQLIREDQAAQQRLQTQ